MGHVRGAENAPKLPRRGESGVPSATSLESTISRKLTVLYPKKFKKRVRSHLDRLVNRHVDCWTRGPTTYLETLEANRKFVNWLVKEVEKIEIQADPRHL
jgi:hypothetical protein